MPIQDANTAGSPRVSVIVPTFNRARDVARCLHSLVSQTFRSFEVLVCDDGSTDDTRAIVERYRDRLDLSYHWAENFGGPARPRNAGLRLARGEYVAFLDSDDWWAPEKLARSVECLDAGSDLVYHDLFIATASDQRYFLRRQRAAALAAPVFEDMMRKGPMISNSSVVVRAEVLRGIGGLSEERALIACEDFDAWLRIAKVTDRFAMLREPLGYYWLGGGNISSSAQRLLGNLERLHELHIAGDPRWRDLGPAWYHYSVGLAHYRLGHRQGARDHMRKALRAGLPLGRQLKARAAIALLALHPARSDRVVSGRQP